MAKRSFAARLGAGFAAFGVTLGLLAAGQPAAAAPVPGALAPVQSGFTLTVGDLQFILQQIKIAEAHATREGASLGAVVAPTSLIGAGPLAIPDPKLPWGLRQVDGRNNNLSSGWSRWAGRTYATTGGKSAWGSADQPFIRETDATWRDSEDPVAPTTLLGAVSTNYDPAFRPSSLQDSTPRVASNLIADQSPNNPAAVAAAGPGAVVDADGSLEIPNVAPNAGVAAPYSGIFALFGQFFDHGLDLVGKTATENVVVPLQPDDPLYQVGSPTNFMIANRTVLDDNGDGSNSTTPWIDQNQTYTSHPSHQVFLRDYVLNAQNRPVATGNLMDGAIAGNIANWAEVKTQAATKLGIQLVDTDIFNVPLLLTDEYGRFLRGPNGMPQLVQANSTVVEGSIASPISTANAARTGHAFLDDIAHNAVPSGTKAPDADSALGLTGSPSSFYDNEMLDRHFITGDGRGNENIGLTSVHTVFHSEHNRLVADVQSIVTANAGAFAATDWKLAGGAWNGERLFQAARFVNEMEYQHLVFGEFVRKIQPGIRAFAAYDPTLRPDITAEYAHAVYRFGHSQLNAMIERTNADGSDNSIELLDGFLNPPAFNDGGTAGPLDAAAGAGSVLRGMSNQIGNEIDEFVTDTLRNHLVGLPLDLATLNIVRGRDTGMASLNGARRSFYAATGNAALMPYASWIDFQLALRHPASVVNFVAAYGTHPSITGATTLVDKRAAADKLVNDQADSPADRADFLYGINSWADQNGLSTTGLENVDLWIGGLAESPTPFGGMLGGTFDYVFKKQIENLQEGDRLYYLSRTAGMNLGVQLENNFFSDIILRNTDVEALPADAFARPGETFDMSKAPPAGKIVVEPDTTWRYTGSKHSLFIGTAAGNKAKANGGDDTMRGNDGDDTLQGGMGNDNIIGGLGNDILLDSAGVDILSGGPGNDYFSSGGAGADAFNGGTGSDFMVGGVDPIATLAGPGNDFVLGGQAADGLGGDDESDWIEGGTGADGLTGDPPAPFGIDIANAGDDVLFGGSGDDLMSGEGGVDIANGGSGVNSFIGGFDFDWQTYYTPDAAKAAAAKADLGLFVPAPADILAGLMDGFDGVEAVSGGDLDDQLWGDIRTTLTVPLTTLNDILNPSDLAKIAGLRLLLPTGTTTWNAGNILIGGRGSDRLEGRAGNDLLDGDAYLKVMLSVPANSGVIGTVDPETGRILVDNLDALRAAVLAKTLDPGNITIVRAIESAGYAGETDVAVFSGNRVDYTITYPQQGQVRVVDNVVGRDGIDTLRNIEQLRFLDGPINVPLPASPSAVTVAPASNTSLRVSWQAPARTGGSAVTGYTVRAFSSADANQTAQVGSCTSAGTTCTITGLTAWTTYYVDVWATNGTGNSAPGPRARIKATTGTPPSAPQTVAVTPNPDGTADVTWTAPAATGGRPVTGYLATAFDAATGGTAVTSCSTTGALTCKLPAQPAGTAFHVEVKASNLAGPGAANTPRVSISPVGKPGAPTSVVAAAATASTVVTFAAPVSDGGSPIISYTAKAYATVNGVVPVSTCTVTLPASPLTCTITGLTAGKTYSVAVTATNAQGEGPGSAPRKSVTLNATAPGAPGTPTVTPASTSVLASWTAPASTGGSPITGYVASVYTVSSGGTAVASCPSTLTLSCTISGLTASTNYWIEVVATNAVGSTPSARTATTTTSGLTTAPSAPGTPTITPASTSVLASWAASGSNGGAAITGYVASAYTVSSGGTAVASCPSTLTLSCTISGLTASTNYWIEVVATNGVGSTPSARTATTTTALSAGSITYTTIGKFWARPVWSAVPGATGYTARAFNAASGGASLASCATASTARSCNIAGLSAGLNYWLEITATTGGGNVVSARVAIATLPSNVPNAPSISTLTPGAASMTVTWTAPTATGGSPITGYTVRAFTSATSGTVVGTCTTAGAVSCTINTGLSAATSYSFEVVPANANGSGVPSNRLSGTTL